MLISLLSELASVMSLYNSALTFQKLPPFRICKNISISDLTAFAAVGVLLFCQAVPVLPATFTALLTLPLQGKEQVS